jgi:hypothetical protein
MGQTKWRSRGGVGGFFDSATHETTESFAGRKLFDDFETVTYNTLQWLYTAAGAGTQALDGLGNAVFTFDATAANQEAGIVNQGNVLSWDTAKGLVVEYRIIFSVLPTVGTEAHIGVLGEAQVDDKQIAAANDYAKYACFVLDGNGTVVIYTDDSSHDNDAIATGVTVLNTAYHVYRIDFTNNVDVRFFIDGVAVGTGTTFIVHDIGNLVQPYVNMTKTGADAGLGTLKLDYIKIWQATR